jgi:hypothetical protein
MLYNQCTHEGEKPCAMPLSARMPGTGERWLLHQRYFDIAYCLEFPSRG